MLIRLTAYSAAFSSGFSSTVSATVSVGTSMFSVSGLPKSDSGSDKILLKIDSGVNLILSSSSTLTTYDGRLLTLSPIKCGHEKLLVLLGKVF